MVYAKSSNSIGLHKIKLIYWSTKNQAILLIHKNQAILLVHKKSCNSIGTQKNQAILLVHKKSSNSIDPQKIKQFYWSTKNHAILLVHKKSCNSIGPQKIMQFYWSTKNRNLLVLESAMGKIAFEGRRCTTAETLAKNIKICFKKDNAVVKNEFFHSSHLVTDTVSLNYVFPFSMILTYPSFLHRWL